MTIYLDSSALVKLVLREVETDALRAHLVAAGSPRTTSAIARVEVLRAVSASGPEGVAHARELFAGLHEIALDRGVLDEAAVLRVAARSLDAIHLASALRLGNQLEALVTYDRRMVVAAEALGVEVVAPA